MNLASLKNVFVLTLLGTAGVSGSAAITANLAGGDAGMKALLFGTLWLSTGLASLIALYRLSSQRVTAYLWFVAVGINVGGTSMMFGLTIPLFALYSPVSAIGATLAGYFFLVLFYQLQRAYRMFVQAWEAHHEKVLARFYDRRSSTVCIEPLTRQLQVNAELFLPKPIQSLSGVVSLGLILSMVVGFNLRHLFPKGSAIAWGIPALTLTTLLLQMAFLRILLAYKLRILEKETGTFIAPTDKIAR